MALHSDKAGTPPRSEKAGSTSHVQNALRVHLHADGEDALWRPVIGPLPGSPPRMRRRRLIEHALLVALWRRTSTCVEKTPISLLSTRGQERITSTHVEKTVGDRHQMRGPTDYLHACGEDTDTGSMGTDRCGAPPAGRRRRLIAVAGEVLEGRTSTGAEKALARRERDFRWAAHLRRRGEDHSADLEAKVSQRSTSTLVEKTSKVREPS